MYIVVIGAGQLGYYLTKDLLAKGHEVTLADWNFNRVQLLEQELGDVVLYASGSSIDGLDKAGCQRADVIVAATGDDEDNLVICQLGKQYFKIPKAVARIRNPKNEHVFRELGVGTTISGTAAISDAIESYMLKKQYRTLLALNNGDTELIEVDIIEDSPANGHLISELCFPKNSVVVLVLRGKEAIFARGDVKLLAGDMVLAMTAVEDKEKVRAILQGIGE